MSGDAGDVLGLIDSPMFIVTTAVDAERAGCLVGFATQTSMDPRRFLVCVSQENRTHRLALRAQAVAVHLLARDQWDLAELFGAHTGDRIDKFARCGWQPGPSGMPILDATPDWFVGRILTRHAFGDHTGLVLEPTAGKCGSSAIRQLGLIAAGALAPGHPA